MSRTHARFDPDQIGIRLATDADVAGIAGLYRACYGDDYPFEEFYDHEWIKRGVYDAGIRWFVAAADRGQGRLLGSSAVMLNVGDADDLVSEIGRLVVHPDARGCDLATKLIAAVTEEADAMSDFAFAECRSAHAGSQVILHRAGYQVVGAEPLAYELDGFESVFFVCRISEGARILRRGSPAVVPAAFELATHALTNCGIEVDVRLDPDARPLPALRERDGLVLEPMRDRQRYRLMRLGRAHYDNPEVFGSFRLEHGHLKLKSHDARHLVLRAGDAVVGGIGYTWDDVDRKLKIFELLAAEPRYRGTLVERALERLESELDPRYVAIDVNAHATELQATLVRLGFAPCVYAPSMVFVIGERFDVIRFVKLRQEPRLDHWVVIDPMERASKLVEAAVFATARGLTASSELHALALFEGLGDVALAAIAAACHELRFSAGEALYEAGSEANALYLVLEGKVALEADEVEERGPGEAVGLRQLYGAARRPFTARATTDARVLVLRADAFDDLVRREPESAAIVLRNLARLLSH